MGDVLGTLPAEVVVDILALLDPVSLTRCSAVSKAWRTVVANDLVWRRVAVRTLDLPVTVETEDLETLPQIRRWSASTQYKSVRTFRQLCIRWTQVQHGWRGKVVSEKESSASKSSGLNSEQEGVGPSSSLTGAEQGEDTTKGPPASSEDTEIQRPALKPRRLQAATNFIRALVPGEELDIWRIKVDPEEGTLIATTRTGGLFVIDIETNRLVWELGVEQVGAYAHLEGERGILMLHGRQLEGDKFDVWVHKRLLPDGGNGELYQVQSSARMPQAGRASRFKWPIFCAMSSASIAYFWDLTDPHNPRELPSIDASARHGAREINYIDFDDKHFFLVGTHIDQVTVYDRSTGQVKWSMAAFLRQKDASELIRNYAIDFDSLPETASMHDSYSLHESRLVKRDLSEKSKSVIADQDGGWQDRSFEWVAIHPDEATGALLVLGKRMLVIVPDFASLTESACRVPVVTVEYRTWGIMEHDRGGHHVTFDAFHQIPLTVADGRAFMVEEMLVLLDLVPYRQGVLQPGSAPFTLPADADGPLAIRIFVGDPKFTSMRDLNGVVGSSCVQMDAANIFAVVPTEAPQYEDAEDEQDVRDVCFEVAHWRVGPVSSS